MPCKCSFSGPPSDLRRLRREDYRWKYVLVCKSPYLNNVVEQANGYQAPMRAHARAQVFQDDGLDHGGLGAREYHDLAFIPKWNSKPKPRRAVTLTARYCIRFGFRLGIGRPRMRGTT
jgi:hypothetical protein